MKISLSGEIGTCKVNQDNHLTAGHEAAHFKHNIQYESRCSISLRQAYYHTLRVDTLHFD